MGKAHVAAALRTPEVELAGVADPCVTAADERWPTVASFGALSERTPLDAVLVAASTPAHEAIVAEALERGVHVLCEKPLTLDPDRSAMLGDAARAAGLVLQVGYWRRFAEPFRDLRALIGSGRLGPVRAIRAAQWDARPEPPSFCDPRVSGGLEVDCGVHEFDMARWLLDAEVEAVTSCAPAASPELAAVADVDTVYGIARLSAERAMSIDLTRRAGHLDSIRVEAIGLKGSAIVEFALGGTFVVREGTRREERPLASQDVIADALAAQLKGFVSGVAARRLHRDASSAFDCARALEAALALRQARREGEAWLGRALVAA